MWEIFYIEDYSHHHEDVFCYEKSKWKRNPKLREQPRPVRNSVCVGYKQTHYTRQQHK